MIRTRKTVLAAMLVAAAVAGGYALVLVPNVEIMTALVFVSGFLLGATLGASVGAGSMAIYSLFNPLGAALPPLAAVQIALFALVGFAGGKIGPLLVSLGRRRASLLSGAIGLGLTLLYDGGTSLAAYAVAVGRSQVEGFAAFLAASLLFLSMHQVWNTMLFALVVPSALRALEHYRGTLSGWEVEGG